MFVALLSGEDDMDRITRLRIKNVRAIESLDLEISPVTVLIGENGAGKSTILECLELLRKATDSTFMQQFYQVHRGMSGLLRKGADSLSLGVVIEDSAGEHPRLEYEFTLSQEGSGAVVESELWAVYENTGELSMSIRRLRSGETHVLELASSADWQQQSSLRADVLVLAGLKHYAPNIGLLNDSPAARLIRVLEGLEIHLGFDTLASWASTAAGRTNSLRSSAMILPAERLSLQGLNLANAWSALKNLGEDHWQQTMALVRLGFGDSIDSILTAPDAGGGNISLLLKRTDLSEPIPSAYLSDGQLSWLAFVAMARLNEGRSLLAIDEPEMHMHPSLLGRVISLLTNMDGGAPVILSTHSDRVLELLENPAEAARVCELHGSTAKISKLNQEELPKWLEEFGDLGQLRSSGYLHRLLVPGPELPDSFGEPQ